MITSRGSMPEDSAGFRHESIAGDGVELHVVRAGEGPSVILLHGFPENWRSWRRQIHALAAAGFSVLAPDMRGYNLSGRPPERSAYRLDRLVADVAALVRAGGHPRAHVVGHDWGGVIAWRFADEHPEQVDRLAILNAPHLRLYLEKARRPPQLFRSWYVLFFLLPRLPECVLAAGNFSAIRAMFRHGPARANTFSDADIEQYVRALAPPGALTAALDYYRANLTATEMRRVAHAGPIAAETLVIWGELDPALDIGLLAGLDRIAPRVRIHRIPGASHWVQNEACAEVNRVLTDFLKGAG